VTFLAHEKANILKQTCVRNKKKSTIGRFMIRCQNTSKKWNHY